MVANDAFDRDIVDVTPCQPSLIREERNGTSILAGTLVLKDEQGLYVDSYEIEIFPHPNYPAKFPFVFEVGGRIPKNIDWHVYEKLEYCCLGVPAEETLACKSGLNLIKFLKQFVEPFFFNQTYRREHGFFYKERSHGSKGILEYYQERLGIKSVPLVLQTLMTIIKDEELARTNDCFCGSGNKYRHCHRERYRALSEVGPEQLMVDVDQLLKVPTEELLSWGN